MHISAPFSYKKIVLHVILSLPLCIIVLTANAGFSPVSAFAGEPIFSIRPVFSDPANPLTRAYFIFNGQPHAHQQNSVLVTNIGTSRGTVNLYGVDAITGQTSGTVFLSHTAPRHDVGAWLTLSNHQVILYPSQSQDIPFQLTIPDHVRPGQHAGGIIAEEIPQPVTSNGASQHHSIDIQHVLALGVLVNLPGPTTEKLEATSVQYDISSSYQRLLVRMNNTGTQLLHPFGSLQVHDTSGHLLQDWSLKLDTFIPQTSIDYPLYIQHKSLSPGTYTAMLNLSYEHHHTLNFTTTFTVPLQNQSIPHAISAFFRPTSTNIFDLFTPWYWIATVIALVILCGGVFFWGQKLYNLTIRLQTKRKQRMKGRS